ncbi:protein ZAR1-like [Danaus plexippus]|uniref:protein ZAR1-like n=1 Tax=Danaus plexippus TaxID=13037 RepID=UPI002AB208CD|nr:protein ZAR1-like [Danaus plexippus]
MGGCCSSEDSSRREHTAYTRHVIIPAAEPIPRQPQSIPIQRSAQLIPTPRQPQLIQTSWRQPQLIQTSWRQPQLIQTPWRQPQPRPKPEIEEPQFGEFRCKLCGRSWKSLRCWPNKYQMCKKCKKPVLPTSCRKIHPSDYTSTQDDSKEHERDLCQMCKQLGYSCKNFRRTKRIL